MIVHPLKWDIGDRDLAMFAALTYEEPNAYKTGDIVGGNPEKESGENYYFLDYAISSEVRPYWNIVDFTRKWCSIDTDFEATTYRNGNSVVIAIRGTDENIGEWINNIMGYGLKSKHVEEVYAKAYASSIATRYPMCDIYITGHSLGGYLTQFAATQLYKEGKAEKVKRIAYFNGMGLNINFVNSWAIKRDEQKALRSYDNQSKIFCYRINGDVVSGMGQHMTNAIAFNPTEKAKNNQRELNKDENMETHWSYWDLVSVAKSELAAYLWYTHETDSFFYYLHQGIRQ